MSDFAVSAPVALAARVIRGGGVIAYPTEAVYGLGCDPANEEAVLRLLEIKERPVHKGLILLGADAAQLRPWIDVSDADLARMNERWPGPVTWVVPASTRVPSWVRGDHTTVAVRVSGHPLARAIAAAAGTPIISTSANLSGRPSARNRFQVARQLGERLDLIVNGECNLARRPSAIIDLASGAHLRR